MVYIMEKQIELSGSASSRDLKSLLQSGRTEQFNEWTKRADEYEQRVGGLAEQTVAGMESATSAIRSLQEQIRTMQQVQTAILQKMGVPMQESAPMENSSEEGMRRPELRPVS